MSAGGRIDIDVVLNDEGLAEDLDATLSGAADAAASAAEALGLALGGAAVVAGLKSVVDAGMEFDQVMNQIRGVAGASASEMAEVSEKARQLGNDMTIPATSASDAAQAMLELGKGGLTVKDSMDAAKGSLQLAAAAQISAGEAAEIQAQSLNTFSLKATDAGRVADVLANTANMAAGEITDIAQGLQQAGSVASQFGMTIEETAGALGALANNGITGSDAGTLLKSTLLALQDTSKSATTAMDTLGVTVYDAQGKFRGLGPIMDELQTASKNLTEEQFNQATSVLFGSDAMRLAGIAAKDGSKSFADMAKAVGETGAAARLGEEMSKGLPGAVAAIGNAADEVKLSLYDLLRGPLTELANFGASGLDTLGDLLKGDTSGLGDGLSPIVDNLKEIGDGVANIAKDLVGPGGALTMMGEGATAAGKAAVAGLGPVTGIVSGVVGAIAALPAPVTTAALAMGAFALARNKIATPAPLNAMRQFRGEMAVQNQMYRMGQGQLAGYATQLTRTQQAMAAYRTSTVPAIASTRRFTDQVAAVRTGAAAAGQPISRLAGSMQVLGERGGALGRIGTSFTTAAAGARTFGTAAGVAAASGTALRVGAGGLMSALGGPWGVAIGAAVVGLSMYSQKQKQAAAAAAEHKAQVDALVGSIDAQTGALTQAGRQKMTEDLRKGTYGSGNSFDYSDQLGIAADKVTAAASRQKGALDDLNVTLDSVTKTSLEGSDYWQKYGGDLRGAGISSEVMTDALRGSHSALKKVDDALVGMGNQSGMAGVFLKKYRDGLSESGRNALQLGENVNLAAKAVREAAGAQDQQKRAMEQMDPRARSLAEAMEVLGDKTSTAAEKSKALKQALDALSGGAEGFDSAMGQAKEAITQLPEMWAAAAEAAGGYGSIIDSSTGRISINSEATRNLSKQIFDVKNSMNDAASAAYDYAIQTGQGQTAAAEAARVAAKQIYDGFMKSSEGAKNAGVDVAALADAMGLLPPEKVVEILQVGGDAVTTELLLIKNLLASTPDKKPITLTSISDEARKKLEGIKGLVVTELPDGKGVTISAETEEARRKLQEMIDKQNQLHDKEVTYTATTIQKYAVESLTDPIGAAANRMAREQGHAVGGGIGVDGAIRGPGSGTSDSIHTMAPAGTHIVTAAETAAAGGHAAVNEQVAALAAGSGRSMARGGPMMPVALSNGEHALSPAQVGAAGGHGAIFAWRQALALGGLVRAEQVGKANDGLPYITGARDCSMWVSWMVQAAKGQDLGRLFTTYSLLGGQTGGLEPGASPSDYLTVGTSQEHMAATVRTDSGLVNTESGGNSSPSQVRWGRGAAGAFDPQFTRRFHLPENLISPPPDDSAATTSTDTATSTTSGDTTTSAPSTIEAPKAPKLEDVAAEAARIGVRGLLETFDMQDSVLADPDKSTIGRAIQIGINTQKYRDQQGAAPSTEGTSGTNLQAKQQYESSQLARKQQYESERLALKGEKDKAVRDQKLLELKQKYDRETLEAKQKYEQSKTSSTTSSTAVTPSTGTNGPADADPYKLVDSAPYDSARGAAQWEKEATAALQITGMNFRLKDAMLKQGDIESKGDPEAVGPDSGEGGSPLGWMQTKRATFDAFKDPNLPDNPFNVLADGVAALNYVKDRYKGEPPWPTPAGYWAGGIRPMRADLAAVVAGGNRRLIGDRAVGDEFFIPDTDDPQHVELGLEWARRRGFQLVNMNADGGTRARAAGGQTATLERPEPTQVTKNYNYNGPADQAGAFFGAARRHDRLDGAFSGIQRVGRKGTH